MPPKRKSVMEGNWDSEDFHVQKKPSHIEHGVIGKGKPSWKNFTTPFHFFELFFKEELWEHIVTTTNNRANEKIAKQRGKKKGNKPQIEIDEIEGSKFEDDLDKEVEEEEEENVLSDWKETSVEEVKTFFAICIVMGLVVMKDVKDYWKEPEISFGIYGLPWIKCRMSRNRFLELRSVLSFDLDYIRKFTITQFQQYWNPFPHVAVDETLLLFKGRFRFKQHIRGKPHSTGVKIYAMCDILGFFFDYFFYEGQNGNTFGIVKNFVDKLPSKSYYTIYTDSYYGSYELAQYLNDSHYFILSCSKNRPTWLFQEFLHDDLTKGDFRWSVNSDEQMFALSFKDRKVFNVLSNFGNPSNLAETKKGSTVPEVVREYNFHMKGVDHGDRFINIYMPRFRNRSWKFASLLGIFYITISNSCLFMDNLCVNGISLKSFLEFIANSLAPVSNSNTVPRKTMKIHLLETLQVRGNCEFDECDKSDKRTTLHCKKCGKYFHKICFQSFHNEG